MWTSVDLLVGLLDRGADAYVSPEDFDGPAVQAWLRTGFLGGDSWPDPAPVCPHCGDGVPYRVSGRLLCNRCRSPVDPRWLRRWRLDDAAVLGWLAAGLGLRGGVQRVDDRVWQFGTWPAGSDTRECFFVRPGPLPEAARVRLAAYQQVFVLFGCGGPPDHSRGEHLSLLAVLGEGHPPAIIDLRASLRPGGLVNFDVHTGGLWVGDSLLGEVPPGSREFAFLERLGANLDHYVPYADLKRAVLRRAGSTDTTEEATFCQKLKSRIKRRFVPGIDALLVTSNKGDGYRLRGHCELVA